jgi:hypothetical protein
VSVAFTGSEKIDHQLDLLVNVMQELKILTPAAVSNYSVRGAHLPPRSVISRTLFIDVLGVWGGFCGTYGIRLR